MRTALLFAVAVGCGGRVVESTAADASVGVAIEETDAIADGPDVTIPAGCGLGDNACYRDFVAAIDGARTCFRHFGGACGISVDAGEDREQCVWPDGASMLNRLEWLADWLARAPDGKVCVRANWSDTRRGEVVFADGAFFTLTFGEWEGTKVRCRGRGSFDIGELGSPCGDNIRTCCRR
jgi:hypothetical protein